MRILTAIAEVEPYLSEVQRLADSNKEALGFLPTSAYSEQAQRGRLWVVAEKTTGRLLGFLLFGGRFPSLKVFQSYVEPFARKRGVATELIKRLVSFGEKYGYLSISARVAVNLPANQFWKK